MRVTDSISASPIMTEKSVRPEEIRAITSMKAGKIYPLAYVPLLREDRVSSGQIKVSLDMSETVRTLMNAVNVKVSAHFVPFLAFSRFDGMDSFNRSYQGIAEPTGGVIPFFNTVTFSNTSPFWKTLGVQWKNSTAINAAPLEAYNVLVNYLYRARSKLLPQRTETNDTLAAAFWANTTLGHIVPDFESAMMDGEVELEIAGGVSFTSGTLPVTGITRTGTAGSYMAAGMALQTATSTKFTAGSAHLTIGDLSASLSGITANLASSGIKLSLANIELAKQTASFAKLREQFAGRSDDYIIDLLMEGIRVPDEAMRDPILLDQKSSIFGYTERRAMDGANLAKTVTTGLTEVVLNVRTPPMNTGGIIIVTAQIVPEGLFERMYDNFLGTTSPSALPNFMRDFLDPEKVDVVKNNYVDVLHATPTATFGYAPLNHAWKRSIARVGGRFYRPNVDVFNEDRQRFWSVEQLNPTLNTDFYLVGNLPQTVFADTVADPFEVLTTGALSIVGNTVFGKMLAENTQDFAKVNDQVDKTKIVQ